MFDSKVQLDHIEARLDAIAELLAALIDSVQGEEEQPGQDLDGNLHEKPENYGGTL
jgi:hypothetical protein